MKERFYKTIWWRIFVALLMIPVALLFGLVIFGLVVGGIFRIDPFVGGMIPMLTFSFVFWLFFAYKIILNKPLE